MKLSILIPVYNVDKYLRQCLDSVTYEKRNDVEILVIDDGSTDNSLNIIKEYDVIYKTRENMGLVYTRKELFSLATGDYILCVDSDDYLLGNSIERIFELLRKSSYPDVLFINECNDYNGTLKYSHDSKGKLIKRDIIDVRLDFSNAKFNNNLWNKVFKRELVLDVKPQEDEKFVFSAEDLMFTSLILNKAKTVVFSDEILYVYRRGISRKMDAVSIAKSYKSIKYVYNFIRHNYLYFNDNIKNWMNRYMKAIEMIYKNLCLTYDSNYINLYKETLEDIIDSQMFIDGKDYRKSFIIWIIRRRLGLPFLKLAHLAFNKKSD